ncbi:MAG: SRPBCC family protein [Heyndrickxia sp.]
MLSIQHRKYIRVKPKKVFLTLSTADGWNAWFTNQTTITINGDGAGEIWLRWSYEDDHQRQIVDGGKILESIPYKSFVFQWKPGENTTTVKFQLEPFKEGTLLQLEEQSYTNEDTFACIGCAVGWGEAMTLLKVYLEQGIVYKQDLLLGFEDESYDI